jgi:hypothetical protein
LLREKKILKGKRWSVVHVNGGRRAGEVSFCMYTQLEFLSLVLNQCIEIPVTRILEIYFKSIQLLILIVLKQERVIWFFFLTTELRSLLFKFTSFENKFFLKIVNQQCSFSRWKSWKKRKMHAWPVYSKTENPNPLSWFDTVTVENKEGSCCIFLTVSLSSKFSPAETNNSTVRN